MVTKKHKEFKIDDLNEGNVRMVDPCVNPDKNSYTDDEELGINRNITTKDNRWTVDTYKGRMKNHKTPQLRSLIRQLVKECLAEMNNE